MCLLPPGRQTYSPGPTSPSSSFKLPDSIYVCSKAVCSCSGTTAPGSILNIIVAAPEALSEYRTFISIPGKSVGDQGISLTATKCEASSGGFTILFEASVTIICTSCLLLLGTKRKGDRRQSPHPLGVICHMQFQLRPPDGSPILACPNKVCNGSKNGSGLGGKNFGSASDSCKSRKLRRSNYPEASDGRDCTWEQICRP